MARYEFLKVRSRCSLMKEKSREINLGRVVAKVPLSSPGTYTLLDKRHPRLVLPVNSRCFFTKGRRASSPLRLYSGTFFSNDTTAVGDHTVVLKCSSSLYNPLLPSLPFPPSFSLFRCRSLFLRSFHFFYFHRSSRLRHRATVDAMTTPARSK